MRVLLVDDEKAFLEQAKLFLEKEDEEFDITTASSAKEGLDHIDNDDFDVIVSDYQMPGMDGLEFLEKVKKEREMDIPFIIFTGKGREEVAMEALNLGADRYLQKGGDPKSQYGVLARAIKQEERHYRTRGELKVSEGKYESLTQDVMDNSDVAMFILDSNFEVVWINKAAENYFGIEKDEVIGKDKEELIRDKIKYIFEDPDHFEEKVISTYKENTYIENFECHVLQDEEEGLDERWLQHWSKPIETGLYEGGRMEHYTDITALKKSEREKEKNLKELEERVKELSCLYSLERIIEENGSIEEVLSQISELIPSGWQYPNLTEARITYNDQTFETEEFEESQWMQQSKITVDGSEVGKIEVSYLEKRSEKDNGPFLEAESDLIESIGEHIGSFLEKKIAEVELESEKDLMEQIAETSPVCITKVDRDGDIIWANQRAEKILGLDKSEIEGRTYDDTKWKITDFEDREYPVEELPFELVKEKEEAVYDVKHAIEWPNGEKRFLSVNATPLYDDEGNFDGMLATIDDITGEVQKERELEETKNRLYEIIDELSIATFVLDDEHEVTHWNKACEELTGLSKDEMIGKNQPWKAFYDNERPVLADMVVEDASLEEIKKHYGEKVDKSPLIKGAYEGEDRFKMKGEEVWIFFTASPIEDSEGNRIGAIETLQDTTEWRRVEEQLKKNKKRLDRAMESGRLAWWEMELPSGEVQFDDKKAEMLGYSPEKFEHYSDFTDLLHPEDHDKAMKAMKDHIEGNAERYEVEYRIKKKDGDYKWFRDVGSITQEKDNHTVVTGIVIDIDERKEIQEREDILHSILRHDLKNKLQLSLGYGELLKEGDLTEEQEKYLGKDWNMKQQSIKLIDTIENLRKTWKEEMEKVSLENILATAVNKYEPEASQRDIEIEVEDVDPYVKAGSLLDEVFSNLILNSILHSKCDEIKISTSTKDENVTVTIEDDGKGISDDRKEKIFDRGYKDEESSGSGLGLFFVKKIIESYSGEITVEDSELGGAKFNVILKKP